MAVDTSQIVVLTQCDCGGEITQKSVTTRWSEGGKQYRIANVPCFQCSDCNDRYFSAKTELALSRLANEMKSKNSQYIEYNEELI